MSPEFQPPPTNQAEQIPLPPLEDDKPFPVVDYLIVNVLFLAFTWILYVLMRALFPDTGGLTFFFVMLSLGFVAVSVYDFIFDRVYTPPSDEASASKG